MISITTADASRGSDHAIYVGCIIFIDVAAQHGDVSGVIPFGELHFSGGKPAIERQP